MQKEIPDTWSKWGNVATMTDEQIDEFVQECHEMNDEEWKSYKKRCSENCVTTHE